MGCVEKEEEMDSTESGQQKNFVDLQQILKDKILRHIFKNYLVSVYVSEGLALRDAIEAYVAQCADLSIAALPQRKVKAKEIYQEFCRSDSPCEVSLGGKTKARLKEGLERSVVEASLFDEVLAEVDTSLEANIPRFLRSNGYRVYLEHEELVKSVFDVAVSMEKDEDLYLVINEESDDDDDDDPTASVGCFGFRKKKKKGEKSEVWYELESGERLKKTDLEVLWRYALIPPSLKVRRSPQHLWVIVGRSAVALVGQISVQDPTEVALEC